MKEIERIYREYFDDVFRYIYRLSGNAHTAEEVTAETFFKALKSLKSFRGDCDVRVWLCQIAKNCYYSHLRKARDTENVDDLTALADTRGLEDNVIQRDEVRRVRAVLNGLPQTYREVFSYRIYAGLSFRQIGQIFGKTENWACVTYHRARNMIIQRLEGADNAKRM